MPLKQVNMKRIIFLDYLRSFITVLVVSHHALLAYTGFASFDPEVYIRSTHAVVDSRRWEILDILVNFNDVYFMPLMFLISGIFVPHSLLSKGAVSFVMNRFRRLFIPFLLGGTLLMLLAYYPSYYMANNKWDLIPYIHDFFTQQAWPSGPPWFIWFLFVQNLLFALLFAPLQPLLARFVSGLIKSGRAGGILFILCFMATWISYVPMTLAVGQGTWTGWGPFDFQLSRLFLYTCYFWIGIGTGLHFKAPLAQEYYLRISKKWKAWALFAFLVFALLTGIPSYLIALVEQGTIPELAGWLIYLNIYSASMVLSSFAFLSLFSRFIHHTNYIWDSLSDNAYAIYLIHFPMVTWGQFLLLEIPIPAFFKYLCVFGCSLGLSWLTSFQIRKIPLIRKYI